MRTKKKNYHRGSSLVYLGLSLILFVITYGMAFTLMPIIFGAVFDIIGSGSIQLSSSWQAIYDQNETTVKYLVPLMPSMGIVIIVIKVLMTSAARGRD